MNRSNRAVCALLLLVSVFNSPLPIWARSQDSVPVATTDDIPHGYASYTLFLVCNPEWLGPDKQSSLENLAEQFDSFGRSIGDNSAAVWFWKSHGPGEGVPKLSQYVDVERSIRYCKQWNLKPSEGPFLLTTFTYPKLSDSISGLPKDAGLFKLGKMSKDQISGLLKGLTDKILLDPRIKPSQRPKSDQTIKTPAPRTLLVVIADAVQSTIKDLRCQWNFEFDAQLIKVKSTSCKDAT